MPVETDELKKQLDSQNNFREKFNEVINKFLEKNTEPEVDSDYTTDSEMDEDNDDPMDDDFETISDDEFTDNGAEFEVDERPPNDLKKAEFTARAECASTYSNGVTSKVETKDDKSSSIEDKKADVQSENVLSIPIEDKKADVQSENVLSIPIEDKANVQSENVLSSDSDDDEIQIVFDYVNVNIKYDEELNARIKSDETEELNVGDLLKNLNNGDKSEKMNVDENLTDTNGDGLIDICYTELRPKNDGSIDQEEDLKPKRTNEAEVRQESAKKLKIDDDCIILD